MYRKLLIVPMIMSTVVFSSAMNHHAYAETSTTSTETEQTTQDTTLQNDLIDLQLGEEYTNTQQYNRNNNQVEVILASNNLDKVELYVDGSLVKTLLGDKTSDHIYLNPAQYGSTIKAVGYQNGTKVAEKEITVHHNLLLYQENKGVYTWAPVPTATRYEIYVNNEKVLETTDITKYIPNSSLANFSKVMIKAYNGDELLATSNEQPYYQSVNPTYVLSDDHKMATVTFDAIPDMDKLSIYSYSETGEIVYTPELQEGHYVINNVPVGEQIIFKIQKDNEVPVTESIDIESKDPELNLYQVNAGTKSAKINVWYSLDGEVNSPQYTFTYIGNDEQEKKIVSHEADTVLPDLKPNQKTEVKVDYQFTYNGEEKTGSAVINVSAIDEQTVLPYHIKSEDENIGQDFYYDEFSTDNEEIADSPTKYEVTYKKDGEEQAKTVTFDQDPRTYLSNRILLKDLEANSSYTATIRQLVQVNDDTSADSSATKWVTIAQEDKSFTTKETTKTSSKISDISLDYKTPWNITTSWNFNANESMDDQAKIIYLFENTTTHSYQVASLDQAYNASFALKENTNYQLTPLVAYNSDGKSYSSWGDSQSFTTPKEQDSTSTGDNSVNNGNATTGDSSVSNGSSTTGDSSVSNGSSTTGDSSVSNGSSTTGDSSVSNGSSTTGDSSVSNGNSTVGDNSTENTNSNSDTATLPSETPKTKQDEKVSVTEQIQQAIAEAKKEQQKTISSFVADVKKNKKVSFKNEFAKVYSLRSALTEKEKATIEAYKEKINLYTATKNTKAITASNLSNFKSKKSTTISFENARDSKTLTASKVFVVQDGKVNKNFKVSVAKNGKSLTVKATKSLKPGIYTIFIDNTGVKTKKGKKTRPVVVNITVK